MDEIKKRRSQIENLNLLLDNEINNRKLNDNEIFEKFQNKTLEFQNKINIQTKRIDNQTCELEKLEKVVNTLNTQHTNLINTVSSDVTHNITTVKNCLSDLKNNLESQIYNIKDSANSQNHSINNNIDSLQLDTIKTKKNVYNNSVDINLLQIENSTLRREINTLTEDVTELKNIISVLTSEC